eukprot:TRINITY_DN1380_c0_g1_i1.p2 TRINITY_DN1380_c0_g1~~TRINITY_DN1380_c0_g1_i1.p2  ORF type:complete len:99 (-),score=27.21 TRINITY_DN1380_c0_g1_i1:27-323(-)
MSQFLDDHIAFDRAQQKLSEERMKFEEELLSMRETNEKLTEAKDKLEREKAEFAAFNTKLTLEFRRKLDEELEGMDENPTGEGECPHSQIITAGWPLV